MSTEVLRPNAAGDETALDRIPNGGEANWEDVDDVTPDEFDTAVYTMSSSAIRDIYNLPAHSVGSGTINFVKVYARGVADSGLGAAGVLVKSGGTVKYGTVILFGTTWTTYSRQFNTSPATGLAWTWADIDALQIGVELGCYSCVIVACTQVYVEIDYTPPVIAAELGAFCQQLSPLGFNMYRAGQVRGG